MTRHKPSSEPIERVVIKIPKSLAEYLRETFRHGQRSEFLTKCIREHQNAQNVRGIEEELRSVK